VLLRPLPYDEPERLVRLWERNPRRSVEPQLVAPPNLAEWRAKTSSFEHIAYWSALAILIWSRARATRKPGARMSLLTCLRPWVCSRTLAASFCRKKIRKKDLAWHCSAMNIGSAGLTLIRKSWGASYGGYICRRVYTIVGVMPASFRFPNQTEVWLPVAGTASHDSGAARGCRCSRG